MSSRRTPVLRVLTLGLLVWQDLPSVKQRHVEAGASLKRKVLRMVRLFEIIPSIVVWGCCSMRLGQYETERLRALSQDSGFLRGSWTMPKRLDRMPRRVPRLTSHHPG